MNNYSYIYNAQADYIDEMYRKYSQDPQSVDDAWRLFFEGFDFSYKQNGASSPSALDQKDLSVLAVIMGFRMRGHLLSTTNPLRQRRDRAPHLDLADYNLSETDLNQVFEAGQVLGLEHASLKEIIEHLHLVYCGNIGFEYEHIEDWTKRHWLRDKIEHRSLHSDYGLATNEKTRILEKLTDAVVFEDFLHTKYIGQKRFSLEGGETTIPAMDFIINTAAAAGVQECIIGMAHRGRLNVLANIMGKTYENIFSEFEGTAVPDLAFGDGDVKYHLGYSSIMETMDKTKVHVKLVPNPSHLESVDPVVEGFARAKADILYKSNYDNILPILLHGDAAVAGQGVVYETAQMSALEGYYTGGTIHYVINNQIGFTTDFDDARSSTYCTAAAYVPKAPVFHVNGDDPEAVVWAVKLAVEYRQKFNSDVFIDMVCYRKHGHNEGDDPKFTQPEMYDIIKKHKDPRQLYSEKLQARKDVDADLADKMEKQYWKLLQDRLDMVKQEPLPYAYQEPEQAWRKLKKFTQDEDYETSPVTGVKQKELTGIMDHLASIPEGFHPIGKVSRLMKNVNKLRAEDKLDWAMGELCAYGTLMQEGNDIRLSGQDVKRGTFSHRHAVFIDKDNFEQYNRLDSLKGAKGKFRIYNSLLSEFAVMGFEYGYSLATPDALVLWEAQFGDFYNGAQTIVDQYISAAESKWRRMSGLVLLLPHGYEGQGPEHSSARLERFLQMCAEHNMSVVNCSNPANFFHVLRRQLHRPFRKPLVVMSPKSLLRHPLCVSAVEDFTEGTRFHEVFDDESMKTKAVKDKVSRVLMCSGKVYYDLLERQMQSKAKDIAIVRLEQFYPFPQKQVDAIVASYPKAKVYWVQEEPMNMGAAQYMHWNYGIPKAQIIARKASASPATGYKKVHDEQQAQIVDLAFG